VGARTCGGGGGKKNVQNPILGVGWVEQWIDHFGDRGFGIPCRGIYDIASSERVERGVGTATGGLGKRMQASPWVADRLERGHGGLGQRMDGSTLGLVDGDDRWGEGEEDACHGQERQAPE